MCSPPLLRRRPINNAVSVALRRSSSASNGANGRPCGRYLGSVGDPPQDETEHFIRCPACSGWIDCRDLAQVFEHNLPLLHPILVTGKDIEARKLGSRREAKDWCADHYAGSPIKEIGREADAEISS